MILGNRIQESLNKSSMARKMYMKDLQRVLDSHGSDILVMANNITFVATDFRIASSK